MNTPQFKGNQSFEINKKVDLNSLRKMDHKTRIMLYFAKFLLLIGIFLSILTNADYFTPLIQAGLFSWISVLLWVVGVFASFLFIPYLYFSSFGKFKRDDDFWDEEIFWILPLFFFGIFFQHSSGIFPSEGVLMITVVAVFAVHFKFVLMAQQLAKNNNILSGKHQYLSSLTYLTLYYLLFLGIFFMIDPVSKLKIWLDS